MAAAPASRWKRIPSHSEPWPHALKSRFEKNIRKKNHTELTWKAALLAPLFVHLPTSNRSTNPRNKMFPPTIPTPLLEVAGAEKQFAISKRLEHLSSQITTSHRLSLPPLSMGMRCGWSGKTFHFGLGGASTRAEQFWLIHLQCWFNLSCVDSKRLLLIFLFFF